MSETHPKGISPLTITFEGECYRRYTKPYMSDTQARAKVSKMLADGTLETIDNPIIYRRAVYIRHQYGNGLHVERIIEL